ncbi:hypothetical protein EV363DRAFT_1196203 [Boletus edulis]|nr:hypothetical protein EV363DRAFT_1196203 [Boletus edulis]
MMVRADTGSTYRQSSGCLVSSRGRSPISFHPRFCAATSPELFSCVNSSYLRLARSNAANGTELASGLGLCRVVRVTLCVRPSSGTFSTDDPRSTLMLAFPPPSDGDHAQQNHYLPLSPHRPHLLRRRHDRSYPRLRRLTKCDGSTRYKSSRYVSFNRIYASGDASDRTAVYGVFIIAIWWSLVGALSYRYRGPNGRHFIYSTRIPTTYTCHRFNS